MQYVAGHVRTCISSWSDKRQLFPYELVAKFSPFYPEMTLQSIFITVTWLQSSLSSLCLVTIAPNSQLALSVTLVSCMPVPCSNNSFGSTFPRMKSRFLSIVFKILHNQSYHASYPSAHPPSVHQPVVLFLRFGKGGNDGWDHKPRSFEQRLDMTADSRGRCVVYKDSGNSPIILLPSSWVRLRWPHSQCRTFFLNKMGIIIGPNS